VEFRDRWIIMFFLGLIIFTLVATQTKSETLTNRFFTLFDLLETIMDHELSDKRSQNFVEVKGKDLAKLKEVGKGLD
jgi:hypothetical protein